jgi:hypothetical protein
MKKATLAQRRLSGLRAVVTRANRELHTTIGAIERRRIVARIEATKQKIAALHEDVAGVPATPAEPFALRDAALTMRESAVVSALREIDEHQSHLSAARARLTALLGAIGDAE